nr:flagellar filament capping protein FliD [Bacillus sp. B15-48]
MASGLDTDTLVKRLMQAESMSLNKLKRQQQTEIWRSDALRELNKELLTLQQNTLFNMKLSSSYNTFDVSSSMPNAISATGTSSALTGTYTVAVNQIAESATLTEMNVSLDTSKKLGDESQGERQLLNPTTIKLSVVNDPKKPSVTQTADITISPEDTVSAVVSKINSAKDETGKSLGLQAYYDANLQQFMIKTKATGEATKITLEADESFTKTFGLASGVQTGQNAEIVFNGNTINTIANNNVTIMGVNLSLKTSTLGQTSTLVVSQNVDAQVKNIKDFVESYNKILDKLNTLYSEPVYRDYHPLLDDERYELPEKQAELWDEKAKSGLLRNDTILRGLVDGMRAAMGGIVENGSSYHSLVSIGISSQSYQDKGRLHVNEDKLREAIQADPDGVRNLFSQNGNMQDGTRGLVHRISDVVGQGIKNLTTRAGSTGNSNYDQSVIGRQLSSIQKNIDSQMDRLANKETQYYKQFAAMESAIARFQSQSTWLYQQMGMF